MENELGRIIDALPGLIWTALPGGDIDFVNQRWCEYTGLAADQIGDRAWLAAFHPEDLPGLLERWQSTLASGDAGEMEARLRRFDGAYRWFLFRASPLADASGQVVKWCGIGADLDDRRQIEESRRARERLFRRIFDDLPTPVALMAPDGGLEHANRYHLEYLGRTVEDLNSQVLVGSFHPDDRPAVLAAWNAAAETGQPYEFDGRRRRADAVYRWFHVRGFPLRDPEGRIVHWHVLQTDIDDRKRAEAMLSGEKRLLEMVATGHPLTDILDALCRRVEDNIDNCSCAVLLVEPGESKFLHGVAPGLPPEYRHVFDGKVIDPAQGPCSLAATSKTQVIVPDAPSDPRWDGSDLPELALGIGMRSCWSTPVLSGDQKVLGVFTLYRPEPGDPTPIQRDLIEQMAHIASIAIGRAQRESVLKRSEAFLKEAQRLSSTGGFSWNVATNEIMWSDEVYRIFDIEPAGPLTPGVTDSRVHPDDVEFIYEKVNRARIDGKDFGFDYRLVMQDGSTKYLHTVFHRTHDAEGQIEFVGAIQDVTERRRSEEALGELRTELTRVARISSLGALTASIAHEVNQPLAGIITNANTCLRMLAADPPNIDGARETARRTIRDGNRASEVITRLRALFTKKAPATERVDLSDAAREVIALSLNELQRNRVILRSEFAVDLPPIIGDRVQLQQVILNLILNASDAMSGIEDRPRQLAIRTERDGRDGVRLAVQDTGIGFDPQDTKKLFGAFYTTKSSGMGIGLFVSRSIVENHRGRLWAEANDGPGATFSFSLPSGSEDDEMANEGFGPVPRRKGVAQ